MYVCMYVCKDFIHIWKESEKKDKYFDQAREVKN